MAISSKLENIGNSCIDIRLAIKEQDNTLAAGSITTLGDDIRTIENRNYAYLLCRTQNGEMKIVKLYCDKNYITQLTSLIDDEIVSCILPENITGLARGAFQNTNVKYVNLENIDTYDALSFNNCKNLKFDASAMVNAKYIAGGVFSRSNISGELYLPNLVGFCYSGQNPSTSSESQQFSNANITKIMDLGSAPRINEDTFAMNRNLTEIHFPETCNLYGSSIFYLDTKLTKIYFKNLESLLKNVTYRYDTSHPFRYLANGTPTEVYVNDVLLTSVVIPNDVTIINPYTFYNFTGLTSVTIPESVTVISDSAFRGCTGLKNVICNTDMPLGEISDSGDTEGSVLHIFGNATGVYGNGNFGFTTIIIEGSFTYHTRSTTTHQFGRNRGTYDFVLRVKGDFNANKSTQEIYNQDLVFFECGGKITSLDNAGILYSKIKEGCIFHLGYNGVAGLASYIVRDASNFNKMNKIYVGDGSSAAHDDAILQQYLADTNWAQYSSKLDTWYNYINSPDANPDYIN